MSRNLQPDDRSRGIVLACDWVDGHLDQFAVERTPEQLLPSLKAIAELAHAGDLVSRGAVVGPRAHGRRWLEHAWRMLDHGDLLARLISLEPKLVMAATAFLPFHLAGLSHTAIADALGKQHLLAALNIYEWSLTSAALTALGIEQNPDVLENARRGSLLRARIPASRLTLEQIYLLLHECLYRSGWTTKKRWCNESERSYLDEALPDLAERFADDTDVMAEVLLVMHTLPFVCGTPAQWQLLEDAQAPSGLVSPPKRRVTAFASPDVEFAGSYHTTLVAIMAWASCSHARAERLVNG